MTTSTLSFVITLFTNFRSSCNISGQLFKCISFLIKRPKIKPPQNAKCTLHVQRRLLLNYTVDSGPPYSTILCSQPRRPCTNSTCIEIVLPDLNLLPQKKWRKKEEIKLTPRCFFVTCTLEKK